jgi:hypothetical protein
MIKTITTNRKYALKQYENLDLSDTVQIDTEVFNSELENKIRYLQFVQLELAFRRYAQLLNQLSPLTLQDSVTLLEQVKLDTISDIKNLFSEKEKENG